MGIIALLVLLPVLTIATIGNQQIFNAYLIWAHEHAGPFINLIKVDPYLDPLRGDPRFEALVSKILSGSVK